MTKLHKLILVPLDERPAIMNSRICWLREQIIR